MRYAIMDKDHNTPLLLSAQPQEVSQRPFALKRLQDQLKAGTLVILPVLAENFSAKFQVVMPDGTPRVLEEVITQPPLNTTLALLDVSREEFCQTLRSKEHFNKVCQTLGNEIYEGVCAGRLSFGKLEENQVLRTICSDANSIDTYLKIIETTTVKIGYLAFSIFAEIKKIPFIIWKRESQNKLVIIDQQLENQSGRNVIHLLVNNPNEELSLMINSDAKTSEGKPYRLMLTKIDNPLEEKNYKRQNLLHLAAASTSADILVTYLLDHLGFKSKINDIDIDGKTALHRALEYFVFSKEKLVILSLLEYQKIMLATLEALVLAGSDLMLKDKANLTPLKLAQLHKGLFGFSDKFDLASWLIQKKTEGARSLSTKKGKHRMLLPKAPEIKKPRTEESVPLNATAFFGTATHKVAREEPMPNVDHWLNWDTPTNT